MVLLLTTALSTSLVSAQTTSPAALPAVKPAETKGDIKVGGSQTVYPLTLRITDRFTADGYKGKLSIEQEGSTAGIEKLCKGDYDVIGSSRAMKAEELATCQKNKRDAIELKVGVDAVVFAVSRQNRFVDKLTSKQLQDIWSGKSKTWKDVNPRWPADAIVLLSPTQAHGTYDFVTEALFSKSEKDAAVRKAIIASTPGIKLEADSRELAKKISVNKMAMGFFGYGYYSQNRAKLRTVIIDDVIANDITVANGKYAFYRPLFIVTASTVLKSKPQVKDFVNYYLSNAKGNILEAGYFGQTDKVNDEVNKTFLLAIK